jgi:two-component system chemotaxis sensor kinase CheA
MPRKKIKPAESKIHHGIQVSVNALSEAVVMCEPKDLTGMAQIHQRLEEFRDWSRSNGFERLAAGAQAAANLVEQTVLGEVADPADALETVGRAIGEFQRVIIDGRDESAMRLPEQLEGRTPEKAQPAQKSGKAGRTDPPPNAANAIVDDVILAEFLGRQEGVLEELEVLILGFERIKSGEQPTEFKRLIHTLKGEASLLGLDQVERLCHAVEDELDRRPLNQLVDPLLELRDWLGTYFKAKAGKAPAPPWPPKFLRGWDNALSDESTEAGEDSEPDESTTTWPADETAANGQREPLNVDLSLLGEFIGEAHEHLDNAENALLTLETEPEQTEALNAVFRAFHTIKGVAGFLGLTDVGRLSHEAESLLDGARKGTTALEGAAIDVTFDAADCLKRMIGLLQETLSSGLAPLPEPGLDSLIERIQAAAEGRAQATDQAAGPRHVGERLGDILVEEGTVSREIVDQALRRQQENPEGPRVGELLVRSGQAEPRDVARALRSQKPSPAADQNKVQVRETVKVDADRLDALVEAIGELVIAESMVSMAPEIHDCGSPKLVAHLKNLDKITRELQEMGTGLRMVPLRSTFQKMARLVRDVARKADKQVDFVMNGEDTELDKMVVDRIGDPLIHMIRNAVDHGLEPDSESRTRAGKPAVGRVELRAFHRGGNIYIEIADDGRGLDREAILTKARERGLVGPDEQPPDRDVFNLIFHPGLSTAKKVTDVSGRGVGMDVVRKNVEALRGKIEIQSQVGRGSTFSICLPLTLAIIDGMVLRVGNERYITPTLSIHTTLRPNADMLSTVYGRGRMLRLQGEMIPVFRMDRLFGVTGGVEETGSRIVIIVENDGKKVGLEADELLGQQQIVIKPLGDGMHDIRGISGGAIMPDGQVSLIVDVAGLVKLTNDRATPRVGETPIVQTD